jgi:hypothetical protein
VEPLTFGYHHRRLDRRQIREGILQLENAFPQLLTGSRDVSVRYSGKIFHRTHQEWCASCGYSPVSYAPGPLLKVLQYELGIAIPAGHHKRRVVRNSVLQFDLAMGKLYTHFLGCESGEFNLYVDRASRQPWWNFEAKFNLNLTFVLRTGGQRETSIEAKLPKVGVRVDSRLFPADQARFLVLIDFVIRREGV